MFKRPEPIWWPPEADEYPWLNEYGQPIRPGAHPSLWTRFWSAVLRRDLRETIRR